ncbi:MAG: hypothetical protein IE919_08295 [Thioclava sp.]|nr:hypothetical protein [Thioclava sp.]MBD3803233.1 hypothetical protein [Thioclava sp.]
MRHDWAEAEPGLTRRLMRATWLAGRWLARPENRGTAAEILALREYLDLPAELIERSLTGELIISQRGELRRVSGYLEFFEGAAAYPWASQAALVASRLAARMGLGREEAMAAARAICRTDLYRRNLADLGAEMPGAREKIEGAMTEPTAVATQSGKLILSPDAFFDGWIFDPSNP